MKDLFAVALAAFLTSSAHSRDFSPQVYLENIPAEDGSIQECNVFRTIPGVRYQLEFSRDNVNWTQGDAIYGLGHEYVVVAREIKAAPPLSPEAPPATPAGHVRNASVVFQGVTGEGGGTMVSWTSLDNGGPRRVWIGGSLVEGWADVRLYADRYGAFDFFIGHPTSLVAPPASKDSYQYLGPLDCSMLAVLEKNLPAMNRKVAHSQILLRLPPRGTPGDPGERKFIRYQLDREIDTDSDGSPDWAEFEIAAREPENTVSPPPEKRAAESGDPVATEPEVKSRKNHRRSAASPGKPRELPGRYPSRWPVVTASALVVAAAVWYFLKRRKGA